MGIDSDALALLSALAESGPTEPPLLLEAIRAASSDSLLDVVERTPGVERKPNATRSQPNRFAGLLVGAVVEREFVRRHTDAMAEQGFEFGDQTKEGSDTDYLVLDDLRRPALRVNVKAHGTFFQKAQQFVGLEPEDTFALATYKVRAAYRKSRDQALPFLFAIASSPALAAERAAAELPAHVEAVVSIQNTHKGLKGWKVVEDRLVDHLLTASASDPSLMFIGRLDAAVRRARWRVLSALKANDLLNTMLDERVPTVSNPNFPIPPHSQPNMHFSLGGDMIGLDELLDMLREHGVQHVATKIAFREI